MTELVRNTSLTQADSDTLFGREWLVTNGLGGYASGTVAGPLTRRYHGLLIAALPAPLGRVVMLSALFEQLRLPDGTIVQLGAQMAPEGSLEPAATHPPSTFRLEQGLPIWRYEIGEIAVERRVLMPHLQNTVHVTYRLVSGSEVVGLRLRPMVHFRAHEAAVSAPLKAPYAVTVIGDRHELSAGSPWPSLRLTLRGQRSAFTIDTKHITSVRYGMEASRGYEGEGELWSPGHYWTDLAPGQDATFLASTEGWEIVRALEPDDACRAELERRRRLLAVARPGARTGMAAELVLAADQFIITPAGRIEDATRARAAGDDVRTVIAGYHWFTDWGRDTMISLEGLALTTGRHVEAAWILRTFSHYVRDGLIPNMFPEGEKEGLYHTADATLWYFHAIDRYLEATGDTSTLELLLPTLLDIVNHHLRGTRFGIGVDPEDGLLRQGAAHYQLTWMDAKVDGWVVTPRRGKAVEINALWYNVLCLLERWVRQLRGDAVAEPIAEHAARARASFNRRFWYAEGGYLYDVVDGEEGDDPACRPNQLFAISLRHPVLDRDRWGAVVEVVHQRLLTPVGLRSLAPGHPDYKPKYFGDLRARDAAYHQGTVWGWLVGPFIDAWLKIYPGDRDGARRALDGFVEHLGDACVGSVSEIFDAEPPFTPRGCVAQACSVAELLRCWVKTADEGTR